ncbi:hypothetical protein Tco_1425642 [Tanacetum coccineum]
MADPAPPLDVFADYKYVCLLCNGRPFREKKTIDTHNEKEHPKNKIFCDVCRTSFKWIKDRMEHEEEYGHKKQ